MEQLQDHKHKWYSFGCKDATFLMTKEEFASLSFSEKVLLQIHKITCKYCRRFSEQTKKINALIRGSSNTELLKLSNTKKQALKDLIAKNPG